MTPEIFDPRACILGEGPLWHPERHQLFWFDIIGKRMLSRMGDTELAWDFPTYASAAGWMDHDRLMVATASGLWAFDVVTGESRHLADLEKDNLATRSNDGRADPWGGFWIGTMGIKLEPGAGAIYRYYRGQVQQLYAPISIPNAICFSPDRQFAYFADTPTKIVMRQRLEPLHGWPDGDPEPWLDLNATGRNPDGAVIDTEGRMWLAEWGSHTVTCYGPNGKIVARVETPAGQMTCPAFAGATGTLYATSAAEGLGGSEAEAGRTFVTQVDATGQLEHQVIL